MTELLKQIDDLGELPGYHVCNHHHLFKDERERLFSVKSMVDSWPRSWHQEENPTEEATEMDTLGSLIDKLVTVNLKMWHNQETLYAIRRMGADEFEEAWSTRLAELHAVVKRCCDLNVQRSRLIDEIDMRLKRVVMGEVPAEDLVREQHKTY